MLSQLELVLARDWTPEQAAALVGPEWGGYFPTPSPDGRADVAYWRALRAAVDAKLVEQRTVRLIRNCVTGEEHTTLDEVHYRGRGGYHMNGLRCTCTPNAARCAGVSWAEWRRAAA